MSLFNRHDFVWLNLNAVKQADYIGPAPMEPISALSLLHRWVLGGYPLIVARQEEIQSTGLRVGLAEPASWGKRRLTFVVNRGDIQKHQQGPGLSNVVPQLPLHWQAGALALNSFLGEQGISAHVYGSSAVQHLTGLPCVTENSDLDVLFKPLTWSHAENLCMYLNSLQTRYPAFHVDGEVLSPSGHAVPWRELCRALPEHNAQLLSKTSREVQLVSLTDYRSGFTCPVGSAA